MSAPALSIIVVTWNTREITRNCLASLRQHVPWPERYEVIVVDNASADGTAEMIRSEFPHAVLLVNPTNRGFGRANNQAMRVARGRHFLLLNSDTVVFDDSIPRLVDFLEEDARTGIVGCRLVFENRTLQASCSRFPSVRLSFVEELLLYKLLSRGRQGDLLLGGYWAHDRVRDVDCVWGAAMMLRREVFEQTGGFDERYFMYGEDLEWCMRVRDRGWRIRFTPACTIVHLDHKSSERMYGDERIDLCYRRLYEIYRSRSGPAATAALFALKTVGALIRTAYFRLRVLRAGSAREYSTSQARYYGRALRFHVLALRHRALGGDGDRSVVPS